MCSNNRLRGLFPDRPNDPDSAWKYVHRLKLDLLCLDSGEMSVSFELHGSTGIEENEDGDLVIQHRNGDEIVRQLLDRFGQVCRQGRDDK